MDSVDVELGLDVGEMLLDRPDPRQDWVFSGHRLEDARPISSRLWMRTSSRRLGHGCGSTAARFVSRRTLPWASTGFEVAGP
jgi:hypothetical protein